jgi:hypothetical protein
MKEGIASARIWLEALGMARRDPEIREKARTIAILLLNVAGAVAFAVLAFMGYYLLACVCIVVGFVRGNRKGGRK